MGQQLVVSLGIGQQFSFRFQSRFDVLRRLETGCECIALNWRKVDRRIRFHRFEWRELNRASEGNPREGTTSQKR